MGLFGGEGFEIRFEVAVLDKGRLELQWYNQYIVVLRLLATFCWGRIILWKKKKKKKKKEKKVNKMDCSSLNEERGE